MRALCESETPFNLNNTAARKQQKKNKQRTRSPPFKRHTRFVSICDRKQSLPFPQK